MENHGLMWPLSHPRALMLCRLQGFEQCKLAHSRGRCSPIEFRTQIHANRKASIDFMTSHGTLRSRFEIKTYGTIGWGLDRILPPYTVWALPATDNNCRSTWSRNADQSDNHRTASILQILTYWHDFRWISDRDPNAIEWQEFVIRDMSCFGILGPLSSAIRFRRMAKTRWRIKSSDGVLGIWISIPP